VCSLQLCNYADGALRSIFVRIHTQQRILFEVRIKDSGLRKTRTEILGMMLQMQTGDLCRHTDDVLWHEKIDIHTHVPCMSALSEELMITIMIL